MAKKKVSKRVLAFRKGLIEHFKGNPPDFDFNPLTSDFDKAPKLLVDIKKQKKMVTETERLPNWYTKLKESINKELIIISTPILLILWLFLGISNGFWTTFKCMVLAVLSTLLIVKWVDYVINLRIK